MSYKNCIIKGVKNGDITEAQAQKQNKLLDDLKEYYLEQKGLTEAEADRIVSREAFPQTPHEEFVRKFLFNLPISIFLMLSIVASILF